MRSKLIAVTLASVFVLSALASSAHALRRIELRNGEMGVTRSGRLQFNEPGLSEFLRVRCRVTFLRTLNRVIPKTEGSTIGRITGIAIDRGTAGEHCERGEAYRDIRDILPLPGRRSEPGGGIQVFDMSGAEAGTWNMNYESFLGTLPNITGIAWRIPGVKFEILATAFLGFVVECLYEGTIYGLSLVEAGAVVSSIITLERTRLNLVFGREFCPTSLTSLGTFSTRPNNGQENLRVALL